MRFSTLLPLAIATGALAVPVLERGTWAAPSEEARDLMARSSSNASAFTATPIHGCLLPWQATNIVNAFLYLLANPTAANFNATADALLANDFTDTSDSINQLAGIPVRPCLFIHNFASLLLCVHGPSCKLIRLIIHRKDLSPSQPSQPLSLDPAGSPPFTSRPSTPSTAATRLAGAGSPSTVPATTVRRSRVSTSSTSTRRAKSSRPMRSSTAARG
jgi:hypothetical protein